MVVVGAVLLVLCLLLGAGIALSNTETTSAEAFGVSLSNVSLCGLFLLGCVLGALAMLGVSLMLAGAARKRAKKRALRHEVRSVRGEQESLAEENARLAAELDRERSTSPAAYPEDSPRYADAPVTERGRGRHGV